MTLSSSAPVWPPAGTANAAITLKVYAHLFDAERHADEGRADSRPTTVRCSPAIESS